MRRGWTPVMRHGTDNGYTNGGCRCTACRTAAAQAKRERTHASGKHRPWDLYVLERRLLGIND